jgi:hypothetical protein
MGLAGGDGLPNLALRRAVGKRCWRCGSCRNHAARLLLQALLLMVHILLAVVGMIADGLWLAAVVVSAEKRRCGRCRGADHRMRVPGTSASASAATAAVELTCGFQGGAAPAGRGVHVLASVELERGQERIPGMVAAGVDEARAAVLVHQRLRMRLNVLLLVVLVVMRWHRKRPGRPELHMAAVHWIAPWHVFEEGSNKVAPVQQVLVIQVALKMKMKVHRLRHALLGLFLDSNMAHLG